MKIHALTTGSIRVKHSFLFPSPGRRRQLDLFMPGPFSDPLPIHCWAIEHEGTLRLVDTGETARRGTCRSRGRRSRASRSFRPRWLRLVSASMTSPRL